MPYQSAELKVDHLELGQLYYKACDFDLAVERLEISLRQEEADRDWPRWARTLSFLMRIRSERLELEALGELRSRIEKARADGLLPDCSSLDYAQGISLLYGGKTEEAEGCFRAAVRAAQTLRERSQALFGLAAVLSQRRQFEACLEALNEVQALVESQADLKDLEIAVLLLRVVCLREKGESRRALDLLAVAESMCRIEQNLYMVINAIFLRGTVHQADRHWERALDTFDLCETLLREKDLRHLKTQIEARRKKIEEDRRNRKRVVLSQGSRSFIQSSEAGVQECSGKFLLLRLLHFLVERPGEIRSKEALVGLLWGEEYHPLRHDNKVYVTVRRLRKLLEKDIEHPKILLTAADGYFLNPEYEYEISRNKEPA